MHNQPPKLSTEQKALNINLDEQKYGTIVEIGAGQEVARQFFSAGAAAGTIAKTSSAYDMQISDVIYGKTERYVSIERLRQMMDHEYGLLIERLVERRSRNTTYFCYAATVTAKSYKQTSECHGWVGIKLQMYPGAPASEINLHVRMMDETNKLQSEALGVLGVNLIYGAFYSALKPKALIEGLLDNLEPDRIEVDLIHFSGPYFEEVDNRLMNLHLVRSWCCRAVMFDADNSPVVPAEELRKKNTLVLRGSFRPPTKVHVDMMESALQQFIEVEGISRDNVTTMAEITMAELASDKEQGDQAFLNRVDLLTALGYNVLISDYLRFFRLRSWIRRYTQNTIGIVLSVLDFDQLFDPRYYEGLEGGILEAMGKLFSDNTHVYVYPAMVDDKLISLDNVEVAAGLTYLLKHLIANNAMVAARHFNEEHLKIMPSEVLKQISANTPGWEENVPDKVAERIKSRYMSGPEKK
ncbi:MAG: nicotinate-nucleotide adenylyltransferase [Gammaproteobacteria bacterium BRH_c0]|nr:MAG: nicotinate-nucleotide adenylyltransferase [Gammaproteobacteria bacterium BRH_c0]